MERQWSIPVTESRVNNTIVLQGHPFKSALNTCKMNEHCIEMSVFISGSPMKTQLTQKIKSQKIKSHIQKHTNKLGTNLQIVSPNFFSTFIFSTFVLLFIFYLVSIPLSFASNAQAGAVSYRNKTRENEDQTLHCKCAN